MLSKAHSLIPNTQIWKVMSEEREGDATAEVFRASAPSLGRPVFLRYNTNTTCLIRSNTKDVVQDYTTDWETLE